MHKDYTSSQLSHNSKTQLSLAHRTLTFRAGPGADQPLEFFEIFSLSHFVRKTIPHPGRLKTKRVFAIPCCSYCWYFCHILIPEIIIGRFIFDNGYVRGSPNGKICKSTNGTVGTIFTNPERFSAASGTIGTSGTIGRSHGRIFIILINTPHLFLSFFNLLHVYCGIYNSYICMYDKSIAYLRNS